MFKFKKFIAMVLAVTSIMCVGATAAAAETPVAGNTYTVTADVYVTKADNFIKLVNAHLTDSSVPPINAPSQNATLTVVDGGYNVTVTLNNETFELTTIATESMAVGADENQEVTATGAKVVSTSTTTSKHGTRIQTITFFVPAIGDDYIYKFDATEWVNWHLVTTGHTGSQTFPIALKVSNDCVAQ